MSNLHPSSFDTVIEEVVAVLHVRDVRSKQVSRIVEDLDLDLMRFRWLKFSARWTTLSRWSMLFENLMSFLLFLAWLFCQDFFHKDVPPQEASELVLRMIEAATSMMPRRSVITILAKTSERKGFKTAFW